MSTPEIGQLVNGLAALFALVVWLASVPGTMRLGVRWVPVITLICVAITAWYSIVNLALVFNIVVVAKPADAIPLFRYAFPLVVVAPALRTLAYRPWVRKLEDAQKDHGDGGGGTWP